MIRKINWQLKEHLTNAPTENELWLRSNMNQYRLAFIKKNCFTHSYRIFSAFKQTKKLTKSVNSKETLLRHRLYAKRKWNSRKGENVSGAIGHSYIGVHALVEFHLRVKIRRRWTDEQIISNRNSNIDII